MIEPTQLPYERDALSPYISQETLDFHYDKHYYGYIENLNRIIKGTIYEDTDLEEIVKQSSGTIFNNAAQAWNHAFYFRGMANPNVSDETLQPRENLLKAIEDKWESLDAFKEDFNEIALRTFGSGWTWLVWDTHDQALSILNLPNADTPLSAKIYIFRPEEEYIPILVADIWEHAYYIDHRNDRNPYLKSFWKVMNWKFASNNFDEVKHD